MPDFGLKFKAVLHAGKVKGIPRMQQEWVCCFFFSLFETREWLLEKDRTRSVRVAGWTGQMVYPCNFLDLIILKLSWFSSETTDLFLFYNISVHLNLSLQDQFFLPVFDCNINIAKFSQQILHRTFFFFYCSIATSISFQLWISF